jgi:hypothetical protein
MRICIDLTHTELDALFGMIIACDLSDQDDPTSIKFRNYTLATLNLSACAPIARKLLAATKMPIKQGR